MPNPPARLVRLLAAVTVVAAFAAFAVLPSLAGEPNGEVRASAPKYRGFVTVGRGPTHVGAQGNAWTLVFRERAAGSVPFKACVKHLDRPRVSRCWRGRTGASGSSRQFVALYVNDTGGVGRWRARWFVRGRRVAGWRFVVRPEFEG